MVVSIQSFPHSLENILKGKTSGRYTRDAVVMAINLHLFYFGFLIVIDIYFQALFVRIVENARNWVKSLGQEENFFVQEQNVIKLLIPFFLLIRLRFMRQILWSQRDPSFLFVLTTMFFHLFFHTQGSCLLFSTPFQPL